MKDEQDTITIERCPICGQSHCYGLRTRRTMALGAATLGSDTASWIFTRIFLCPATNREYQADIVMERNPNEMITGLEILGIAAETGEDEAKGKTSKQHPGAERP
jgi:hypothetical protein